MPNDQSPAELREAYESMQKELKKIQKQNESLSQENRKLEAREAFRDAELSPNLADLFVAAQPEAEISVDSALEFAQTYGVGAAPAAEEGGDESGDGGEPSGAGEEASGSSGSPDLNKFARAGSGAGGSGQPPASDKTLTRDEFLTMQRDNPTEAQKALAEGRVKLRTDNPLASGATPTVGRNPFNRQGESQE